MYTQQEEGVRTNQDDPDPTTDWRKSIDNLSKKGTIARPCRRRLLYVIISESVIVLIVWPPVSETLMQLPSEGWFFLFLTIVNMAFLTFRSPKGGQRIPGESLRSKWIRKPTFRFINRGEHPEPEVVDDMWALHIGYCDGCSEKLYLKESVGKELVALLTRRFRR